MRSVILILIISTAFFLLNNRRSQPEWLLTTSLTQATFTDNTLSGHPAGIMMWSERPDRLLKEIDVDQLLSMFHPGGTFYIDPPNAVISNAGKVAFVELTDCRGDWQQLNFTYKVMGRLQPDQAIFNSDSAKHVVLTIDNVKTLSFPSLPSELHDDLRNITNFCDGNIKFNTTAVWQTKILKAVMDTC